jgi:alkanesulfonate monooxygenase SsuD/methylene tetrahydromethanopterin reductase-like flavin-dependent oxidoreductase (luciferase family)
MPELAGEVHLAVALDGAGWHPLAWREAGARPAALFDPGYWVDLVTEAERGLLDFVTVEDSMGLQGSMRRGPDPRTDRVQGRLDALMVLARVALLTSHIGLVPTVTTTFTEPFHVSKAVATLDWVSGGRAGWRAQLSRAWEEPLFGRRPSLGDDDLFAEAADHVEVVRRLWDSWEDDAEIRDVATGRFVDRDRLHYVDFEGAWFSVRGPSITPRPPQGQPVVVALAHVTPAFRFGATSADLVLVTPHDADEAVTIVDEVRSHQADAGRADEPLHLFADLVVALDSTVTGEGGADRLRRLDAAAGKPLRSDALVHAGSAATLADTLEALAAVGLRGFRLRPAVLPDDLLAITHDLVPELQRRGRFRTAYDASTLRGLLGLPRPANRYHAHPP